MINNYRLIYVGIIFATMLDSFAIGILLPILPFILIDFGANAFWVGALMSVQFIGGALGSVVLGKLADNIPRGILLLISLCVIALGNWALLWVNSLIALFIIRGVVGFMSSNLVVFESIVTGISTDEDRSIGLARLRIGSTMGLILGPAFATAMGTLNLINNRTDMLIVIAIISSLIPFVVLFTFKGEVNKIHISQREKSPHINIFKAFLTNSKIRDFSLIKMLIAICFGLLVGVVPVWSKKELGWTSTEISNLILIFGLSLLSIQIFIALGKAKWLNSLASLSGACFIVLPGFTFAILFPSGASLFLLSCLIGFSSAIVNITIPSTISKISYGYVGAMLGLMATVVLIGSTIGPMFFGFIYDYFGYSWSLFCGFICAAYATYLSVKYLRTNEITNSNTQEQA